MERNTVLVADIADADNVAGYLKVGQELDVLEESSEHISIRTMGSSRVRGKKIDCGLFEFGYGQRNDHTPAIIRLE